MSFQTGLSGLNASSKNLDVIGHNIANANTTGMKASRVEFAEMYASALGAAGGTNSGIGVEVSNVAQLFSQGNIKVTGNQLDLAINGGGFFMVEATDGSTMYTRNGEFKLDTEGHIVTNNGARLQGFPTDENGLRTSVVPEDLVLPTGSAIDPRLTGEILMTANLDAGADIQVATAGTSPTAPLTADQKQFGTALNVYDSQGNSIPVQVYFVKTDVNTWDVVASTDGGTTLQNLGQLPFDGAGAVDSTALAAAPLDQITLGAGGLATGVTGVPSDGTLNVTFAVANDLGEYTVSQFGSDFGVYDLQQDGYAAGELTSIDIGENGVILARYSNGVSMAEGQVALGNFRNLQGMQPVNGGYWTETYASGPVVLGGPQEGRLGLIRQSALEESNVDLTQELVNMIVAQRAYQANAQTIKTQDQVQQTLVNLR